MSEKNVSVRFSSQGGNVVAAEFTKIGREGARAFDQVQRSARAGGTGLQNVGYQVQDFAVQVAGGTSASRALAQQLPQLLSGFGMMGVLLGTAAAVFVPLISYMFQTEDRAEGLKNDLDALSDALKRLHSADEARSAPIMDIVNQYGRYAEQAKAVLDIERQIAELVATRAFATASQSVSSAFDATGGLDGMGSAELSALSQNVAAAQAELAKVREAIAAIGEAQSEADDAALEDLRLRHAAAEQAIFDASEYRRAILDIAGTYHISEQAAADLAIAAAKVGEADTTEARLAAAQALAEAIYASTDGLKGASDETVTLYQQLLDAVKAGLDLSAIDIASGIGEGADEAARLGDNLALAANKWLEARSLAQSPLGKWGSHAATSNLPIIDGQGNVIDLHKPKHGGGGGKTEEQKMLEEEGRIFAATRNEAEQYAQAIEDLDKVWKATGFKGKGGADTYARALEAIEEKFGDLSGQARAAGNAIRSAFDGLFDDPKKALEDLAKQLAQMALYQGLAKAFPSVFGSDGFLPLLGARASGGPVSSGGAYLVGERGPELFVPPSAGNIVPNGALRAGGGTVVQIVNNSGAPVSQDRSQGPDGEEMIRIIVGDQIERGAHDKRLRRFGVTPARVKR